MPIKLLIVDDHEVVRLGLVQTFANAEGISVVGQAGSGREAAAFITANPVDVALVDIRLPDFSGIDLCSQVTRLSPNTRVLMLSTYSTAELRLASRRAGAAGYLVKQLRADEIVQAVAAVAAGQSVFPAEPQEGSAMAGASTRRRGAPLGLTDQEQRVLQLVAAGLSNREIANEMCLAEKTVKNYVSSVMAKLGVGRRTEAAIRAVRGEYGPEFVPQLSAPH